MLSSIGILTSSASKELMLYLLPFVWCCDFPI
uniref:Uncharacterized protein n=1 Tax=Rhizophora mucronata TaxID=61149 RepID=A0A2P2NJ44_RHIMU